MGAKWITAPGARLALTAGGLSDSGAALEDRCADCPELLADSYGRADHRRCLMCLLVEKIKAKRRAGKH